MHWACVLIGISLPWVIHWPILSVRSTLQCAFNGRAAEKKIIAPYSMLRRTERKDASELAMLYLLTLSSHRNGLSYPQPKSYPQARRGPGVWPRSGQVAQSLCTSTGALRSWVRTQPIPIACLLGGSMLLQFGLLGITGFEI